MTINRRFFFGGIISAAVAPAFIRATNPVVYVPERKLIVPDRSVLVVRKNMPRNLNPHLGMIDGILLCEGHHLLVFNQTNLENNGVYEIQAQIRSRVPFRHREDMH
jgi:hypothetical protein